MGILDYLKRVYDILLGENPEFEEEDEETYPPDSQPPDGLWYRKYLGTNPYSDHLGRTNQYYYAATWENNDINRERELGDEIIQRFNLTHLPDYGYDDDQFTDDPEGLTIFPQIETGTI